MSAESASAGAHARRTNAAPVLRSATAPALGAAAVGAHRRQSTAQLLGALSDDGWRVFHDARWPGRPQMNIDHVLVGPSGVFVIEAKDWTGNIDVRGGALKLDGRRRARHVIASAAAAMAVGELLPGISTKAIHPVICFDREESIFGWSGDVMICSTENAVTFLTSRPRALDQQQMTDVAETLAVSLDCASAPLPLTAAIYSGATPPAVAARPAAPARKKLPRAPMPEPVRLLVKIGIVAVAAALAFQFDLPARVGHAVAGAAHRVVAPTVPIGTTAAVPGLRSRPTLEVTADKPIVTRSKLPGVQAMQGHQLIAVPVSVHNIGDKVWSSHSDVSAELTDTTGETYSSDPAYTKVRAGTALPESIKLSASGRTSGLVVFEVPSGTKVSDVRLKVGPGLPTTLHWSVD